MNYLTCANNYTREVTIAYFTTDPGKNHSYEVVPTGAIVKTGYPIKTPSKIAVYKGSEANGFEGKPEEIVVQNDFLLTVERKFELKLTKG